MVLQDSDWWLAWTTLGGAVVGSVVAGIISYIQARQATKETLARDEADRLDRDKTTAFRVHVKLSRILSNLGGLHRQIELAVADADARGLKGALWTKLEPFAGVYPPVCFDADELAIFASMKEYELLGKLMTVDDNHNSYMEAVKIYSTRRLAFEDKFGVPRSPAAPILTPDLAVLAAPLMEELDALATDIRGIARDSFTEVLALANRIGAKFKIFFDDPAFPSVELPEHLVELLKASDGAAKP
ncbi:MAG TPA: hypothetical protein VHZ78_15525 [Rhizomicrobium sp.]|jgi:hypothetical protein|nr:hypothetical protein [Rhizomicrobium sp.]